MDLPENAQRILHDSLTELVNNSINHSGGTSAELFVECTEACEFSKTRIVVKLFAIGVSFVSRSEAKRILQGLERFREIVLDFVGVMEVGQGFADEVFRVWASTHPEVRLTPVDMCPAVEFMVRRAGR